jgi:hypothetical protein
VSTGAPLRGIKEDTVSIGIGGASNLGRSIATQLAMMGEAKHWNPWQPQAVVAEFTPAAYLDRGVSGGLSSRVASRPVAGT